MRVVPPQVTTSSAEPSEEGRLLRVGNMVQIVPDDSKPQTPATTSTETPATDRSAAAAAAATIPAAPVPAPVPNPTMNTNATEAVSAR